MSANRFRFYLYIFLFLGERNVKLVCGFDWDSWKKYFDRPLKIHSEIFRITGLRCLGLKKSPHHHFTESSNHRVKINRTNIRLCLQSSSQLGITPTVCGIIWPRLIISIILGEPSKVLVTLKKRLNTNSKQPKKTSWEDEKETYTNLFTLSLDGPRIFVKGLVLKEKCKHWIIAEL